MRRRSARQTRGSGLEKRHGRKMRLLASILALVLVTALVLSLVLPFVITSGGGRGG